MTRTDALTARFFDAARDARFAPADAWNRKSLVDTRNFAAEKLVRETLGDATPTAERLREVVVEVAQRVGCRASEVAEIHRAMECRIVHTFELVG